MFCLVVVRLPSPSLVVLVGPSGSGKSSWADGRFGRDEIVSSDRLRAVVGRGARDLEASDDAFDLLDQIVAARLGRKLMTVIDSTGLDPERRRRWVDRGSAAGLEVFAVPFRTPRSVCVERNRQRSDRVPVKVIDAQVKTFRDVVESLESEGFGVVEPDPDTRVVPPQFRSDEVAAVRENDGEDAEKTRSLSFGLQLPDYGALGDRFELRDSLRSVAVAAERAGFESLWVMDHLMQIPFVGRPWLDMLESYTTLAYLAGVTERIRLGTMVTGITFRNMAHLAKIIATLDVVSGGRAEAGLGAAWFEAEHRAYGFAFPGDRERLDRLEDALGLLPAMWAPGAKPFVGKTIELSETTCYPRPLQERIPITVGGQGEVRTLRLVAALADACNLRGDLATVRHKIDVLARHCRAVGRDPLEVRVTHLGTALVGDDPAHTRQIVDRLRGSQSASAYAKAVNAASVDDHIDRFSQFAAAGVDTCIVSLPDVNARSVERFGEVIDRFGSGGA